MKALIVKTGDTLDTVKSKIGDFDQMFLRPLRAVPDAELTVVEAHKDAALPASERFDCVYITGSPHSVCERAPWADRLSDWTRSAIDAGQRVLGVCYGHQLIGHAMGGVVAKNPKGYEVGCVDVELSAEALEDPLLGPVARGRRSVKFNMTHQDAVIELPKSARRLASTPMAHNQAFAIGDRVWGVQFHPEFTREIMELYIEGRTPMIERDAKAKGIDPSAAIARAKQSVCDTPDGDELLQRFLLLCRERP